MKHSRSPTASLVQLALLSCALLAGAPVAQDGPPPAAAGSADPASAPAGLPQASAQHLVAAKAPTGPQPLAAPPALPAPERIASLATDVRRPAGSSVHPRPTPFERFSYRTTGPPLRVV